MRGTAYRPTILHPLFPKQIDNKYLNPVYTMQPVVKPVV